MPAKLACSSVCLLALAPASVSAQSSPVGVEFQVNSRTAIGQTYPAIAIGAGGGFVVAWTGYGQDGDSGGIFARRFSAAGVPQATEFQVNSFTPDFQYRPAVATDAGGGFVVVWTGYGQDGQNGGVFARRFNATGVPQATEFQVNSFTADGQNRAAVALDADGDFVIAWQSYGQDGQYGGIFARRFSAAGDPQAAEFQVNSFTTNGQYYPALSLDADGDFVVAWQSYGQDGDNAGIFARRFSAAGDPQAAEFQANSFTPSGQYYPALSLDTDGDFVVAWTGYGQDGDDGGVFAQSFNAAGSPQAAEFQVSFFTPSGQYDVAVALDADGDFIVAWNSFGQDGYFTGVFARRFGAAIPQAEFQVNSYTAHQQYRPAVAVEANGNFVVAWESFDQDGSQAGIFAQRFAVPKAFDIDGDGEVEPLTDALLLLRYSFGFRGATLVTGAVDLANCTRCTASAIEGYLALLAAPGLAEPNGDELQINSYTSFGQIESAIAVGGDGRFDVVWSSPQDGFEYGVFLRRFDRTGAPLGPETQVNFYTFEDQRLPAVAASASGDFVVVWEDAIVDGSGYGIFGRRFDSSGAMLATELQINVEAAGHQQLPAVAMNGAGAFVVAWNSGHDGDSGGIFARRFSSAGAAQGGEFQVNAYTPGYQGNSRVAMESGGDFAIAWTSFGGQDGDDAGIFARHFDSAGVAGPELQVNGYTPTPQTFTAFATAGGGFVAAWSSPHDGSQNGVFARRLNGAGVPQAAEFEVNTFTEFDQFVPELSGDASGAFVVAWTDSGSSVFARRYDSTGAPLDAGFRVNTYVTGDQVLPVVALGKGGDFMVAWESRGQDGSSYGVFAQPFAAVIAGDIDGDGEVEPLTDALLLLRYSFGFRGATLVTGAVDLANCTRCTAPAIESYLAANV